MSPSNMCSISIFGFVPGSRPEKITISEGMVRIDAMTTPVIMHSANRHADCRNFRNVNSFMQDTHR